ncbi:galactoside 2-alpha-L-fucosyltransferase [Elaeis guineensis]|uniref:Fucosyltransferase n=1 Tax=Elaeis guineensis var. tenera TaxID=51953 RepID=A0A6I9SH70_ELAGV|nr:galactoside 2-alpha-L-fucosyltransferase [Elaeis guineensis]XP_010943047.1 galactoside 2-alpha-L-fucosyltransferase [Elaeis guineensis]
MDMKRIRRHQSSPAGPSDLESNGASRHGAEKRPASRFLRPVMILLACLMLLLVASGAFRSLSLDRLRRVGGVQGMGEFEVIARQGSENGSSASSSIRKDKLLGGLLAAGFDEESCLSRYQAVLYRKESPHLPSPYLLERLRKHEVLQRKCGPNTELYNKAVEQLKSGQSIETAECNYVVWISYSGLGNRVLTLASAFLYALLTNRVLLIDRGADMADLFCEPFPESSWLLPLDFPVNQFNSFDIKAPQSYGNMLEKKVISNSVDGGSTGSLPAYVYLHLDHDYGDFDKLFFCEDDQRVLQKIPWLVLKSDNYFVPSLFLIPTYEEELHQLFPEKDTVFHHLGRYLFHPTNTVWGLITRYYQSYLAKAEEKVGIQVRVFDTGPGPFQHVLDQILGCSLKEKLLPDISAAHESVVSSPTVRSKAVLMTSLNSGYYEKIRNMYWEHPTVTGEIISVYQPSHEEYQQTGKQMHNMKAWAEMYLLSLSDVLVTSAWSTFGYVAQGLGGLKPWIMFKPENETAPDPPCRRVMSMEPCFHAPPFYDCKAKRGVDTGALVPHVKHCEDMSWGLKLVDQDEW